MWGWEFVKGHSLWVSPSRSTCSCPCCPSKAPPVNLPKSLQLHLLHLRALVVCGLKAVKGVLHWRLSRVYYTEGCFSFCSCKVWNLSKSVLEVVVGYSLVFFSFEVWNSSRAHCTEGYTVWFFQSLSTCLCGTSACTISPQWGLFRVEFVIPLSKRAQEIVVWFLRIWISAWLVLSCYVWFCHSFVFSLFPKKRVYIWLYRSTN